jgi:hypothetical protein
MPTIISGNGSLSLKEPCNKTRQEDNAWNLERGNHKSGNKKSAKVCSMVHDEVAHGFSIPLYTSALAKLRDAQ